MVLTTQTSWRITFVLTDDDCLLLLLRRLADGYPALLQAVVSRWVFVSSIFASFGPWKELLQVVVQVR